MKTVLLVRMGEIFLKGDNRNFFIKALVRNLRKALEGTDCTLELTQGRIFLRDIQDMDEVIRRANEYEELMEIIKENVEMITDATSANEAVKTMQNLNHIFDSALQAKDLISRKCKELGLKFDKIKKEYAAA